MAKAALLLILSVLPGLALAQAPKADLACKATGTDFVFDCTIRLSRGGKPLEARRSPWARTCRRCRWRTT